MLHSRRNASSQAGFTLLEILFALLLALLFMTAADGLSYRVVQRAAQLPFPDLWQPLPEKRCRPYAERIVRCTNERGGDATFIWR